MRTHERAANGCEVRPAYALRNELCPELILPDVDLSAVWPRFCLSILCGPMADKDRQHAINLLPLYARWSGGDEFARAEINAYPLTANRSADLLAAMQAGEVGPLIREATGCKIDAARLHELTATFRELIYDAAA